MLIIRYLASVLSKGDELIEGVELALSYVWALLGKVSSTDVVPWLYHVVGELAVLMGEVILSLLLPPGR